jgi:hypothetical protein
MKRNLVWAVVCLVAGTVWLGQELRLILSGHPDGVYGREPYVIVIGALLMALYSVPGIALLTVGARLIRREILK